MSLSETRLGANVTGLPGPASLPPLTSALSRRTALFGALTAASYSGIPAVGQAATLSANDARLVAIAAELRAVYDRTRVLSSAHRPVEDLPSGTG